MLQRRIEHLLTRPVGRPPKKPIVFYASFRYQAKGWTRVSSSGGQGRVAPGRALSPRRLYRDQPDPTQRAGGQVLQRARHRRAAHQGRQERHPLDAALLPCLPAQRGAAPAPRPSYNLANFLRTLALPEEVEHWTLTTLREKLVKVGAKIVRHGSYVVFQLAEVAVPRVLFAEILRRIDRLRPRPPPLLA